MLNFWNVFDTIHVFQWFYKVSVKCTTLVLWWKYKNTEWLNTDLGHVLFIQAWTRSLANSLVGYPCLLKTNSVVLILNCSENCYAIYFPILFSFFTNMHSRSNYGSHDLYSIFYVRTFYVAWQKDFEDYTIQIHLPQDREMTGLLREPNIVLSVKS